MDMTGHSAHVNAVAGDYWDAFLETQPLFATAIGDRRFDDMLPDPSPAGRAAARRRFADLLDRVTGPGTADTGDPEMITVLALRESLAADIAAIDAGLGNWNVDPLDGVPADLLQVPDYQQVTTPADGRRMVRRWQAMAEYTDRHVANLRRSLSEGRVACRAPAERTVSILEGLLAAPDEAWPLLAPLARVDDLPGWSTADRQRVATDLRAAVATGIRPAFTRLHGVLVDEVLPRSRPADQPGLGHVPGGAAAYRAFIRIHTSLDLEPEALHRIGLDEIARLDGELAAIAGRTIGATDLSDALARLRGDPALYFTTREEVFETAAACLARATAAIPAWFGRLPRASCEVVRMGSHEEQHSTIAYYRQPAVDGARPGQYFLNTALPGTRPRYEAEALAYHEAVPGHHLQIAIGQELPDLPQFRRHLGTTAFFEGWGLYVERLADEMGLYSGDLDRIGVLSFDAWRAARLVVDTGMHALGWTRREAIEFMLAHTALASNNIANEVDRYIVLPGQALAYKTGQLELLRLRREARARLGAAFDIRDFHDTVLGGGALPLEILRATVDSWTARRVAGA
jgi:uncharacterized protein (DUF885 family)